MPEAALNVYVQRRLSIAWQKQPMELINTSTVLRFTIIKTQGAMHLFRWPVEMAQLMSV